MLVLTRKEGESLQIGSTTVTVVTVLRGRVRLGIEAPPEVVVLRTELRDRDPQPEEDRRLPRRNQAAQLACR